MKDPKAATEYLKGRGAQINPANRFHLLQGDSDPTLGDAEANLETQYIRVHPKTIINKVDSEDIPFSFSINPYQGCEHGCVYCYARNTHNYWGYSAGTDFEQKILVKQDAPQLLERQLQKNSWKASPIMLSGNTDCYQPVERKLRITRRILEVCWKYRHPLAIITKNSLIIRDLDLLQDLAQHRLVRVAISLTTLDSDLQRMMEPRTASVRGRLQTIERLAQAGIPVTAMLAPIIPGLNEHEILPMARKTAEMGALGIGYTMVRLNGDVSLIFEDWLRKNKPDRADKVLKKIRACHGGELSDSRFKIRMRGEGQIAEIIHQQFQLAKRRFFQDKPQIPSFNLDLHEKYKTPQLSLF